MAPFTKGRLTVSEGDLDIRKLCLAKQVTRMILPLVSPMAVAMAMAENKVTLWLKWFKLSKGCRFPDRFHGFEIHVAAQCFSVLTECARPLIHAVLVSSF